MTLLLEERLGHRFRDPALLEEALTHPSRAETRDGRPLHYQRLEFLGDAVLGLVSAEILHARFPAESEGALARRHTALVRYETVALLAREWGLPGHVRLSTAEEAAGGAQNDAILADLAEAVIAALYLDGGLTAVKKPLAPFLERMADLNAVPPRDAKTTLQEWAQGKGLARPVYTQVSAQGPSHAPVFVIEAAVTLANGERITAHGEATAKRAAEQLAAEALMETLS